MRVDAGDAGVGLGAANEGEMHRLRGRQVGDIASRACDQPMVLQTKMGQRLEMGDVVHARPL